MKKLLLTALILFISNITLSASAQIVRTETLASLIEQQQVRELKAKGYKEVEAKVLNIPVKQIQLADGIVSVKFGCESKLSSSRTYKKVDIYVNCKYQRSLGVPIEIKIFENVMVAKDIITKDTPLSARNVDFKRQNILALPQKTLTKEDLRSEIIASKIYRPGEIIDQRFSKIKPDIVKNAMVTVIFKTDNEMEICVDGIALVEGKIGNFISVENKTYKKVYMGKVIGVNKVLVEI